MKSIISRVANSVICNPETRRNKARKAESVGGVLNRGQGAPSPYVGVWVSAVSSPNGKFGFWSIFGPRKSRQNGQLAFESEGGGVGTTSESGEGQVPPCPNVEPPLVSYEKSVTVLQLDKD